MKAIDPEMESITVSSKYQIVLPKAARERLKLRPGQKLQLITLDDRIELVPVVPASSLRGAFKGIDTDVPREDDRV